MKKTFIGYLLALIPLSSYSCLQTGIEDNMPEKKYPDYPLPEKFPLAVKLLEKGTVQEDQYEMCEFSQLILVTEGAALHCIGIRRHLIQRNDVLIVHAGTIHAFTDCSDLGIFIIIYDSHIPLPMLEAGGLALVEQLYPHGNADFDPLFPVTRIPDYDHELYVNLIRRLSYETHRMRIGRNIMIPTMFTELIVYFARGESLEEEKEQLWLLQAPIEYLNNHYRNPLDLNKLSRLAGMSERSLFRHFQKVLGVTPNRYLQKIRIQHATEYLKNSLFGIEEIAFKCGFCNGNHLSKVFRREVGISPVTFRKKNRK